MSFRMRAACRTMSPRLFGFSAIASLASALDEKPARARSQSNKTAVEEIEGLLHEGAPRQRLPPGPLEARRRAHPGLARVVTRRPKRGPRGLRRWSRGGSRFLGTRGLRGFVGRLPVSGRRFRARPGGGTRSSGRGSGESRRGWDDLPRVLEPEAPRCARHLPHDGQQGSQALGGFHLPEVEVVCELDREEVFLARGDRLAIAEDGGNVRMLPLELDPDLPPHRE